MSSFSLYNYTIYLFLIVVWYARVLNSGYVVLEVKKEKIERLKEDHYKLESNFKDLRTKPFDIFPDITM